MLRGYLFSLIDPLVQPGLNREKYHEKEVD